MEIEQLVFILLIIFALYSVFATNLKRAIIGMSVFGLWMSFVYLLYHAPDVAIAEAVIASSLGTILYIIAIKKYDDISVHPNSTVLVKRSFIYITLLVGCGFVIYLSRQTPTIDVAPLYQLVMESYATKGGNINPVATIYLNYRVFDTIFEALMLLISGVGVVHLLRPQGTGGDCHE